MSTNRNAGRGHAPGAVGQLITVKELASLLRLHEKTVARLCREGALPRPVKIGGSNRWRVKDIQEAIRRSTGGPRASGK